MMTGDEDMRAFMKKNASGFSRKIAVRVASWTNSHFFGREEGPKGTLAILICC